MQWAEKVKQLQNLTKHLNQNKMKELFFITIMIFIAMDVYNTFKQ